MDRSHNTLPVTSIPSFLVKLVVHETVDLSKDAANDLSVQTEGVQSRKSLIELDKFQLEQREEN